MFSSGHQQLSEHSPIRSHNLFSDTNEIEYSVTQRFYLRNCTPVPAPIRRDLPKATVALTCRSATVNCSSTARTIFHLDAGRSVIRSEFRRRRHDNRCNV